jgi:O-antigen/teichoic acid export membrane protein
MAQRDSIAAIPERPSFLLAVTAQLRRKDPQALVFNGSIIMLLSSTLVSLLNFAYNVVMARMLGPSRFGHVTASVTLLMLASAVTLSFQLVCAKFVARNRAPGAKAGVYRTLRGKAWMLSLAMGGAMVASQHRFASYLHFPDSRVLAVLAIGIAAYVPLGVRRGALQGLCSFERLSVSFIIEAVTRLLTGALLVGAGYGVFGAVGAISAAVLAAHFVPPLGRELRAKTEAGEPASFREGIQAIVFFVGQVTISNVDILLVKHFFAPDLAGLYAAVALVGRLLYFASWSVVSAMFPVTAAAKPHEEADSRVVLFPLLVVVAISVVFIFAMSLFPHLIIHAIFGVEFHQGERLLALYAAATGIYSLSVVIMAYEMSRRIANTGWLQLVFSGMFVLGISAFHGTLRQVILVQIVLMSSMLVLVSLSFLRRYKTALTAEAV